jgi:hypothetical protein
MSPASLLRTAWSQVTMLRANRSGQVGYGGTGFGERAIRLRAEAGHARDEPGHGPFGADDVDVRLGRTLLAEIGAQVGYLEVIADPKRLRQLSLAVLK